MAKYKFKVDRMGFRAGHTFSDGDLKEGVVKTLLSFNAIEILDELDAKKNVEPAKSGSKPRRNKGSSKGSRRRAGSDVDASDRGGD